MASIISASTTSATALNLSGDTSGVLQIATGATPTTAVTVDASQNVGIGTASPANKVVISTSGLSNHLSLTGSQQNAMQFQSASGGAGYIVGRSISSTNNNDFFIYDLVANATRLGIDSSGRITTPSQPAFHANCNGITVTSGTTLLFQTVATNIGNNYNSSTSTFTAPIAGTYYIYGSVMANTGTGRLYWRFAKNGSFFPVSQAGGDSTNYGEWFGSMTVTLAAGDTIFMYLGSGTPYSLNANEQYFGGYLLG